MRTILTRYKNANAERRTNITSFLPATTRSSSYSQPTMIRRLLLVLCVACAALGASMDAQWHSWKSQHSKSYGDQDEEDARRLVWYDNLKKIVEHNSANKSYTLALNEFADLTQKEFFQLYLSPVDVLDRIWEATVTHSVSDSVDYSDSKDWREEGLVTSVKNQGQCGSCWAFSATGALEGQHFKKAGKLVSLSEQQLVDCSWKYGNAGCNGGLMDNAFQYIKNNGGICSASNYPYRGYMWQCKASYCSNVAKLSGYVDIKSQSEDDLIDAVANVGPVCVAIDASSYGFQFYSKGVYTDDSCSQSKLNHGVLVTGYGVYSNQAYWHVKNSWGTSWGNSGYIMMARNYNNMCGIATAASYPYV